MLSSKEPRLSVTLHQDCCVASVSFFVYFFCHAVQHATPFECSSRSSSATGPWGWGDPKNAPLRDDGYPATIYQPEAWRQYAAVSSVGVGAAYYDAGVCRACSSVIEV